MNNMLKGALVQVGLKSISHLAFIAARAAGIPDAELRANPWYNIPIPDVNIPTDDFVTCLGVPVALLLGSKITKDPQRRETLKKMTEGSLLTGGAVMLDHVIMHVAPKLMPPVGQFNIDYDFPSTNLVRQASWLDMQRVPMPHRHSGEELPFQTEMGY